MARILFAALLLLFTLPAAAQTPGDSIAFVTADWHTTDLGRGAACRHIFFAKIIKLSLTLF